MLPSLSYLCFSELILAHSDILLKVHFLKEDSSSFQNIAHLTTVLLKFHALFSFTDHNF